MSLVPGHPGLGGDIARLARPPPARGAADFILAHGGGEKQRGEHGDKHCDTDSGCEVQYSKVHDCILCGDKIGNVRSRGRRICIYYLILYLGNCSTLLSAFAEVELNNKRFIFMK